MGKHYFLGLAANYKLKDALRQLFARGSAKDSEALVKALAEHYDTAPEQVALFGTGRTALAEAVTLLAPEGAEVIITSLTCYAVVQAVKAAGCEPAFADVEWGTLHFGAKELEACFKKHPEAKAVIVQNNLGIPADMAKIEKFCKKNKLALIEDLAHCAGVYYADGREAGTVGAAAVLSFGKGKSIDVVSGGALIMNKKDDHLLETPADAPKFGDRARARWYPLIGWTARGLSYVHLSGVFMRIMIALHFVQRSADAPLDLSRRMPHWQAKLALPKVEKMPRRRRPIRDHYIVNDREDLLMRLEKMGYYFNDIWYDTPVAPARYYGQVEFPEEDCPVAVELSEKLVNFPTYYARLKMQPAQRLVRKYLAKEPGE